MVRRVCVSVAPIIRSEGYELVLGVDEIIVAVGAILGKGAIKDMLSLSLIIYAGVVAPAVLSEQKGCDIIELTV